MNPTLPFYILAFLSVASALMVIISSRPVHSVLYLIFCFFTIGAHYLLLNAQFLFAVHLIVYAGAIMVLFLFSLMFINMNEESDTRKPLLMRLAATVSAGLLLLVLVAALGSSTSWSSPSADSQIGTLQNLGKSLYGEYLLPFELTSILLLTAMVGSVMLGKKSMR